MGSGGARREEGGTNGFPQSHREAEEVVRDMMQGIGIFQTVNRLATQRGQLPLCRRTPAPLSGRGGAGGGLKCKRGRGSETGGK